MINKNYHPLPSALKNKYRLFAEGAVLLSLSLCVPEPCFPALRHAGICTAVEVTARGKLAAHSVAGVRSVLCRYELKHIPFGENREMHCLGSYRNIYFFLC